MLSALGTFVAELQWDDVPPTVRDAARLQVLNMVAAVHAAARSSECRSILPAVGAFSSTGSATVLANGLRRPPHDAALANAALAMAQDFDDIVWMGHTCHSAVFAPLAVAEHLGADARAFLTAVVAANEVAGRIGASAVLGPLNGQMWTFLHCIGAAAGTARLLGLDARQTTHALGIALAQPPFALQPGFMTPSSKLLAAATPTVQGITAAFFAQAGMTGDEHLLEDPRGFWARFSYLPLPNMLSGLGDFWTLQTLQVKTFPGCHYFQTACTALADARKRLGGPAPDEIASVRIDTTKTGVEATRFASEYAAKRGVITAVNVNFDVAVTAAVLLLAGRLTSDEVHPEWLEAHSEEIRSLAARVEVHHSPELTLRTIRSARAVDAGRGALDGIRVADVARLIRRYRQEYRSELLSPAEVTGWARAVWNALRGDSDSRPVPSGIAAPIPLLFPSTVTVTLRDGRSEQVTVDLPVGSLAAPGAEAALREKFIRETTPRLGEAGAVRAYALGRGLGDGVSDLSSFVGAIRRAGEDPHGGCRAEVPTEAGAAGSS